MPGVGSGGSPVLAGSGPTGTLSAVAMGRSAGTSGLLGGSGIADVAPGHSIVLPLRAAYPEAAVQQFEARAKAMAHRRCEVLGVTVRTLA